MTIRENQKNKYCNTPNYDKFPFTSIDTEEKIVKSWESIAQTIGDLAAKKGGDKAVIVIETYQGVMDNELIAGLSSIGHTAFINTAELFLSEDKIREITYKDITDDRIFGFMTRLKIDDFMNADKLAAARQHVEKADGPVIVYGTGASRVAANPSVLVYADMTRWEIQLRMRANKVANLGLSNFEDAFSEQYKRGFFLDWRVCDRLKKELMHSWDFVLDTNIENDPRMLAGSAIEQGLKDLTKRPFRVVPFFDPGPWGGQWMKDVCDLDKEQENFAWCFDCVPEENSLTFKVGEDTIQVPSINLVFDQPKGLMGTPVYSRFGDEFPIRFDFLDTMEGGNLSLQVHPTTEFIREEFGIPYTQDESYYMLDAIEGADVYIGLKNGIDPKEMISDLHRAQNEGVNFDAEKYINRLPVKKHDHILIPNGTVHCSGEGGMVLEISATPYIFTFKLWDWGRLGMDGKPRPINIERGEKVIDWTRDEDFVKKELFNVIEPVAEGEGWREERTGLHRNEFIETRRHWFSTSVHHDTNGIVNVLNLIEGREAIVESPTGAFEPFVVHYAETFIVPAEVGAYTIRPYGESEGKEIATLKAYVRV
ncbi:class I mannose-6-phosphate isomerase [Limibacter armeniacum]|uniref:class I mannose-6-phosphate isomerase n=1 Tax=Limibacter armeniacum TaxID=466084 RepID=UPI002FE58B24